MTTRNLKALEQVKSSFGAEFAEIKLNLLRDIDRSGLRTSREVVRFHEVLCFLQAYPDDAKVLARVERVLGRFSRRADFRRHREALANTGIAGTTTTFRFFWSTVHWLVKRWPDNVRLDREDADAEEKIALALPLLVSRAEAAWLKEDEIPPFDALDRLRARGESDAVFLVRRVGALPGDSFTREAYYDAIDAGCILDLGPGTPCRTGAKYRAAPFAFQARPLWRTRPNLRREILRPPKAVHRLPPREGERLIEFARGALVTRERDLDAFSYGNPRDAWLVDDGEGLAFAVNGVRPERRALVIATYGYLTLHNGVPVGYGDLYLTGASAAISFNTFETFRGGEAAHTFARLLAMVRRLFGCASFSLDPYQLGKENDEGISSGAWWFYFKLGFRPRARGALQIARKEIAHMKFHPAHRSAPATLRKLAEWPVFFDLGRSRPHSRALASVPGKRVANTIAARAIADRESAWEQCRREAMRIAGLDSLDGFSSDELRAWINWSPLLVSLPGVSRWSRAERRALANVVRAKGGTSEIEFVRLFSRHVKLQRAVFGGR